MFIKTWYNFLIFNFVTCLLWNLLGVVFWSAYIWNIYFTANTTEIHHSHYKNNTSPFIYINFLPPLNNFISLMFNDTYQVLWIFEVLLDLSKNWFRIFWRKKIITFMIVVLERCDIGDKIIFFFIDLIWKRFINRFQI